MISIVPEKSYAKCGEETSPRNCLGPESGPLNEVCEDSHNI